MEKIEALVKELTETCEEEGVTLLMKTFSKEANHTGTSFVGSIQNLSQALVMLVYDIEEVTGRDANKLRLLGTKLILNDEKCDCPNCREKKEKADEDDKELEPSEILADFLKYLFVRRESAGE